MKGLTVPADTIVRCRDQPAVLAHALGEMVCGPWQHVVRRFEPCYMPRAVAIFQRAGSAGRHADGEASRRTALIRACSSLPSTSPAILALASPLYDPPEHAIQQAPAMLGESVRPSPLIEELPRYADARPVGGRWRGIGSSNKPTSPPLTQFTSCGAICPAAAPAPRLASPEASVEAHRAHHQSAICVGEPSQVLPQRRRFLPGEAGAVVMGDDERLGLFQRAAQAGQVLEADALVPSQVHPVAWR